MIQLIWICQLGGKFLVPARFLHLPIRSRVYFFVADDCQPPTHCSASYLCRVSAGRAVNTRYYKCNDCVIVCIPQVSLICKTGHPHDTSHNRSHSLSHPQPSEPRLEVCTSLKKPLSFSIDTDPEWVGVMHRCQPDYWDLCTWCLGHNIDYFVPWGGGGGRGEGGSRHLASPYPRCPGGNIPGHLGLKMRG